MSYIRNFFMPKVAKKKVAFFDVDGTIFRSSLIIHITERLIARGLFPAKVRSQYEAAEERWLNREGEYPEYIVAVVDVFMKNMRGMLYLDFMNVVEEVVSEQKKKLYRHTRDLAAALKKKGYYLVAVSQSPKGALDLLLPGLGFDKVYGRVYELGATNRFTGHILELNVIANKSNIVKRVVEKENLTLTDSIAVGDTEDDIPMLELVERPIAFNPNMKLYKYAKRMGWEIVVERKDVIYKL